MSQTDKNQLSRSLKFPFFFVLLLWIIKFIEAIFNIEFGRYGIYPLHKEGLIGILTAPLIHKDFGHLISNSLPVFLLTWCIFYFYKEIRYRIFILTYLTTGLWVWVFARPAFHIGASGLVYGFASFLFFSGILRRNLKLFAISLMIVFLYGGLLWGLLPLVFEISWESHLMGAIAGLAFAFLFKKSGPQREPYSWELNPEKDDDDDSNNDDDSQLIQFNYEFKPKDPQE